MRQLRHTGYINEKRMGLCRSSVEQVSIFEIDDNRIKAIGEFKYLGTLICNRGVAVQEVTRRIQSAALIFSVEINLECINLAFAVETSSLLCSGGICTSVQ